MMAAAMSAMMATNDSTSIEPYPMMRAWLSFWMSFGVVPDEMSAWKPDNAPHAIVMNRNGNSEPAKTGPLPCLPNDVIAGMSIAGRAMTMPSASRTIVPTFMNVDR